MKLIKTITLNIQYISRSILLIHLLISILQFAQETAYDNIYDIVNESQINRLENKNIIYLGDSENDNPALRKADISIGIKSDERLNPKLDCQYLINFNQLPKFLLNLLKNDFIFSENLL